MAVTTNQLATDFNPEGPVTKTRCVRYVNELQACNIVTISICIYIYTQRERERERERESEREGGRERGRGRERERERERILCPPKCGPPVHNIDCSSLRVQLPKNDGIKLQKRL